jgi:hypothetical protein
MEIGSTGVDSLGNTITPDSQMRDLIQQAISAATTRVGAPSPNQMKLLEDALKTAGGVYGNQMAAETNKGIYNNARDANALEKQKVLSPAAGVGVASTTVPPANAGQFPIGTPEQLDPANPKTILSRYSDGRLPKDNRPGKGVLNIGDLRKKVEAFMGGK